MKKLIILGIFLLFISIKSQAQTYSDFPGGAVYGNISISSPYGPQYETDDVTPGSPGGGYSPVYFYLGVWAEGDLGDDVDLVESSGSSYASGTWDQNALSLMYPGENFILHYSWEIDYTDGTNYNICGDSN